MPPTGATDNSPSPKPSWKPARASPRSSGLRKMVKAGHIDVDNEPDSGVIVYLFPDLVGRPAAPPPEISNPQLRGADGDAPG